VRLPSGDQAAEKTGARWPVYVKRVVPAIGTRVGITRVEEAAPCREDMYHIPPLPVMIASAPIPSPSNFRLDKERDGLSCMLLSVHRVVSCRKIPYSITHAAIARDSCSKQPNGGGWRERR